MAMNVLIIEDEMPARARLIQMLKVVDESISIAGELGSVKESVKWLKLNPSPDIAFVDIQLSDDHSFEIFRQFPVKFPVVFTTAFDKYLLESFEYNSIDYLLKPITQEKLSRSMLKVKNLQQHFLQGKIDQFIQTGGTDKNKGQRVIAKKGTEFIVLEAEEIAYFYTEHKIVFVKDASGRKLIVDHTLAELEDMLDPKKFFRINRKYLAHLSAIGKFKPDNGKILVHLNPDMKEEIHVSKETAPEFRQWIGKKIPTP
jgi:DNA-binding LytR/AlgR family response regulator